MEASVAAARPGVRRRRTGKLSIALALAALMTFGAAAARALEAGAESSALLRRGLPALSARQRQARKQVESHPAAMPPQGVYEYCAPASSSDGCVGRLRQIAAAGFKVVLNYAVFDAGSAELLRYMSTAARLRLQLIWPMKDRPWWGSGSLTQTYPALAAGCRCSGNDAFLRYVVGLVIHSPATWGYYLADELEPADAPLVTTFSRRLRALDPRHPRLAIATGEDTVAQLLAPIAPAADVIGADSYPIGTGQPLDRVGLIGRAVKAVATATQRKTAMVIQAFNWSAYPAVGPWPSPRWPTADEMRRMRDIAISTAHPSLILWYSYFNIADAPDANQHWRNLVWAAYGR
jgi:hypothetical protein